MENESVKELEVAETTETEEESVNNEVDEELHESDFEEDESEEEESADNDSAEDEAQKSESNKESQSKEENAKYAAARRRAEKELEAKTDEAFKKGQLSAYKGKMNPYTQTEIKDMTDVEVYEDMYKIAEAGGDPLKDYASYAADKKREAEKAANEKQEREEKARAEIDEFSKKYPDVNISELLKDEMFMDYADGKSKSLIETYESYNKFKRHFRNAGIKTAKKTIANNNSSPGSLNSESSKNTVDYNSMSREEFLKEVEKAKEGK